MPETNKEETQILVCAKLISESSTKAREMKIPPEIYLKTSMIFLASGLHALFKDDWREMLEEVVEEHIDEIERTDNARN